MRKTFLTFAILGLLFTANAQQARLSKAEILNMTIEELSELPLEDLMQAVETLGVSSVDELFSLIMNKNVSSASKEEEDSFLSPLSTTVITKAEMRTYGISTIEESFRLIPGMIVTEKTNGVYDIQMRGLNNIPDNNTLLYTENANILLMIDGRPVQNSMMGAVCFDMLPISIEDVERVEVVRGACSSLYGANAVQGVINIITEKPTKASAKASGSLQMGNQNTYTGEIGLRGSWLDNKLGMGFTANIQNRDRSTNKIYVMPNSKLYYAATPDQQQERYGEYYEEQWNDIYNTSLIEAFNGGWYDVNDIDNLRLVDIQTMFNGSFNVDYNVVYNASEPETPAAKMFKNPELSRKSEGYNGYITVTPSDKVRFDLTGGYQRSEVMTTAMTEDIYSFNTRSSKGGYVNLNAQIHDLQATCNYSFGPQDYSVGTPGYKVFMKNANASLEYTFHVKGLSIKPGVSYQWTNYLDYLPKYNNDDPAASGDYSWSYHGTDSKATKTGTRLFGYFNNEAELWSVAPSLRLDYKLNDLRLIAAFRSDKTNIPDKWNHSWQFAANYKINDNNFVRFVYGRANRGAVLTNTSSDFQWNRTNMTAPSEIVYVGNKNADLLQIDNFELGYRLKPTSGILLDAEVFYSRSENFGALMSQSSMQVANGKDIFDLLSYGLANYTSQKTFMKKGTEDLLSVLTSRSYIQYNNLPYKANQYGLSLNMDWIISNKLIAKVNANVQQTVIDNYYEYNQSAEIASQTSKVSSDINSNVANYSLMKDMYSTLKNYGGDNYSALLGSMMVKSSAEEYKSTIGWSSLNADTQNDILSQLYAAGTGQGAAVEGVDNPLSLYYALKYNITMNTDTNEFFFGSSDTEQKTLKNGHKHKATPNVYGMVGLIYKPVPQISLSAFGNYIGERTYETEYGSEKLDDRFTVNMNITYKPVSQFGFFFNAHNLFNTEKKEFAFSDKIGGIYTLGINFNF